MPPLLSRRNVLKASAGLAMASLSGLASRWAGRLRLPGAVAGGGKSVLTEDLRLDARELAAGSTRGTKVAGGRLTLAASGPGEYVSPELRSSFAATHAGLHWRGSAPQAVSFWLRSSPDARAWSDWQPVVVEAGHGREPLPETFGALIRSEKAQRFQFRARLDNGNGQAEIQSVTVTVLNAEDCLPASPLAAPSTKPLTYSREDWGADEGLRFDSGDELWPRDYVPAKTAVIHHTATGNGYSSTSAAMADVRAIYTYHAATLGWGDIGYCWLIDKFGNAYEGRRGRDGSGYDGPGGRELVGQGVVGGHARSYNHGSTGIAMLGTFQSVSPSAAALSKLRDVLAWECSRHGLDPQDSADFLTASDNWHRGLPSICGHRDTFATACPGGALYALLPGLRNDVASRLNDPSAPTVSITTAPRQGTHTDRDINYAWQGDGGSGAKEYSYYLEGWSLDSDVLVVYKSGFNAALKPAWSPWSTATQASLTLYHPGHFTFHVRARDSLSRVSVREDTRTLLSDVAPMPGTTVLDEPAEGSTVRQPFMISGWAIDEAAVRGTGVDVVHVYAYPVNSAGATTGSPVFLGEAPHGGSRPDVGAHYGQQFTESGYGLKVNGLPVGLNRLVVYARSTVSRLWSNDHRVVYVSNLAIPDIVWPTKGATLTLPVTLDWRYVPGADRYEVERWDKFKGRRVVKAAASRLALKDAQANVKNWWRVRACKGARCSPWSDWRYFRADLAEPAVVWPTNASNPRLPVTLDWRYVPGADRYEVERWDSVEGSRVVEAGASKLALDDAQANIRNWWRVRACQDSHCGPWSDWLYFKASLAVPTVVWPSNGITADSLPVTLDWRYVPGATGYQVKRYDLVNGEKIVSTSVSNLTVADVQASVKNWWRVRACQDGRCGPWSKWRYFSYSG